MNEAGGNAMRHVALGMSLVVFPGAMYHMSVIFFQHLGSLFMGSTHVVYCEFFNKKM